MKKSFLILFVFIELMAVGGHTMAQELAIRRNIATRFPDFPVINEVKKTSVSGIYEIRAGTEIYYSDRSADHLIRGEILDAKTGINITRARIEKLTAIDFSALPLQDAIMWSQGDGSRKIAVFSDPNCGFCKKFEPELRQLKNVTVYTFPYPILSADSEQKSRTIWCAKDRAKVWEEWMVKGSLPEVEGASCDAATVERNLALGHRLRIVGTPTIVFEDGRRSSGMLQVAEVETKLRAATNSQSVSRR